MAQLKDLIVNGASQLIGDVYTSQIQVSKINAATSAGGTTYGPGTNGQVLLSNGTNVYWGSAAPTITESTVSGWGFTKNAGTVTSVQVQATSPVISSTSSVQSNSLNTTISLADGYGDTKNPYASKTKNYVLAAPSTANGTPTFRALVAADIPTLSTYVKKSGDTMTGDLILDHAKYKVNSAGVASLIYTHTGFPSTTAGNTCGIQFDTTTASGANSTFTPVSVSKAGYFLFGVPCLRDGAASSPRFIFYQKSIKSSDGSGTNYYEIYTLPRTTNDLTANATYDILTTKNGISDISFDDSTRQLQKTINETTTSITTLAIVPGSGTYSAIGGELGASAPTASGQASFAYGNKNTASGSASVALGNQSTASGSVSMAVGALSVASGTASFAGGNKAGSIDYGPTALGLSSFSYGVSTKAAGGASQAFGQGTIADASFATAFGNRTIATGRGAMAMGQYNIEDTSDTATYSSYGAGARKYLFTIGNGTADNARSNALTVDWDGNTAIAGSLMVGSSSFGSQLPTTGTAGQIFFQEDNNSYVTQNQIGNAKIFYGVCSTAAATTAKEVTCADFTSANLVKGAIIYVTFDNTNSGAVGSLTMSVNGTTAKSIKHLRNGVATNNLPGAGYLAANQTYRFIYDGTNWITELEYDSNSNTLQRTYRSSTNVELPIAAINTASSTAAAYSAISSGSYKDVYAAIPNTDANRVMFNPSTGLITFGQNGFKTSKIQAPTTAGGSTYGAGSSGQALMSNGSTVYWGNVSSGDYVLKAGDTMTGALYINNSTASSSTSTGALRVTGGIGCGGYIYATKVYGAVFNDYAEYREIKDNILPGNCVIENGDGTLKLTTERLMRGCEIISDTYGFAIGQTKQCQTPVAVSGRVLAYCLEGKEIAKNYIGWPVCSGPNGTVSIMTEEEEMKYPSRIIGTISEIPNYEIWGDNQVKVNNRIWVRIK